MIKLVHTKDVVQYALSAEKAISKLPLYIAEKPKMRAKTINNHGIAEARKCKGYQDEPLKDCRKGQCSIPKFLRNAVFSTAAIPAFFRRSRESGNPVAIIRIGTSPVFAWVTKWTKMAKMDAE